LSPSIDRRSTQTHCCAQLALNEKEEMPMARKPNYSFERQERDRADAKKAAEKAAAKAEKRAQQQAEKGTGAEPQED
jgi:hypothetical protein